MVKWALISRMVKWVILRRMVKFVVIKTSTEQALNDHCSYQDKHFDAAQVAQHK